MCAAEGRSSVHFMTQTSKIPTWPNIRKSVSQNVQQSVFRGKARKYQRIFTKWKTEAFCLLSLFSSSCSLLLVCQGLFTRKLSPHFKITTYRTFLRGLLLLFLGPEDLRPSRGTNHSSSLNETMLPSNLMAGSFHLHSSDNFDAYLSEVFLNKYDKFLSFWSGLVFGT